MIVGLTGTNGSGKTVAAEHLKRKGFAFHSLSDVIREELAEHSVEPNRENLIAEGNRLRSEYGPGVLAERVVRRLRSDVNYVVDSIRNPHEVRILREQPEFHLLHLDAPRKLRFERVQRRGGSRRPASFEEFCKQEDREIHGEVASQQQLCATWKEADETIINDGTLDSFLTGLTDTVREWIMGASRPNWDEYFMQIAQNVALRSNCMKRKVGAVVVMDRRIVTTGYNGTPRGVTNCNEGGCPRCNSLADSGTRLDECLCSHAEENAIVQAAYHGIGVNGGTLYSTCSPCLICTKIIINAGISRVVFNRSYGLSETATSLLAAAGVELYRKAMP